MTLGLSENGSAGNISGFTPANDANNTGNAQRKGIQGLVQKGMLYNMILQGLVCYIIWYFNLDIYHYIIDIYCTFVDHQLLLFIFVYFAQVFATVETLKALVGAHVQTKREVCYVI